LESVVVGFGIVDVKMSEMGENNSWKKLKSAERRVKWMVGVNCDNRREL
jgi:hypothetical protein